MYQVLHINKIKTEIGLTCKAKHNSREEIYNEDLTFKDPEKVHEWIKKDLSDAEKRLQSNAARATDVLSIRKEKMQNLARKPQKNASAAIEFVVSASSDFQGDWQDFFNKSKEFLIKKFGENVISCAIHADETTPHMHIIFVPIIEKNGKKRYSSSQFLGGRDGMKKLHTQFYEEVGQFFGLERGEENSRARHNDAREFSKKVKEVAQREAEVSSAEKELDEFHEDLYNREIDFAKRKLEFSKHEEKLTAREAKVSSAEKEQEENEKFFSENIKEIWSDIKRHEENPSYLPADIFQKIKNVVTNIALKLKQITEELEKTKKYDWRKKSSVELFELATKKAAQEQKKSLNRADFER